MRLRPINLLRPGFLILACALALTAQAGEPSARSLKECPKGHQTLKDVRIIYGLAPAAGRSLEEWDKAVANFEVVAGGCIVDRDSPKRQVVCTTCRFTHSIASTKSPKDGRWILLSSDETAFVQPLSARLKSFPVPARRQLATPVTYSQSLNDKRKVLSDSVSYDSTLSFEQTKREITQWLRAHKIADGLPAPSAPDSESLYFSEKDMMIMINRNLKTTSVFASFPASESP